MTLTRGSVRTRFRSLLSRFRGNADDSEPTVELAEPEPSRRDPLVAKPRGIVAYGRLQTGAVASWLAEARREYSVSDLRQAARLPVVNMIVSTIIREVHSYALRVRPPEDAGEERDGDVELLGSIFAKPYSRGIDTFRTAVGRISRDLMVVGHSDVELLRARMGQTSRAIREFRRLPESRQNLALLMKQLDAAMKERGPLRGWQVVDPAYIRVNLDKHGTLLDPAYYDISPAAGMMGGVLGQVPYKRGMVNWDQWDFCRLYWQVTSERERRSEGRGPVEEGYPLIDILWTVLVRLADEIERPIRDRLISFQPSGAVPLTGEQIDDLVEGVRQDLEAGNIPVLGGVTTQVAEVGPTVHPEHLNILDQISVMLWVLFGTGLVRMGKVQTMSRATAEAEVAVARKQAVGNLMTVLLDDLFEARFVDDPWSEFKGLLTSWEDTGRQISREDRMVAYWEPLMRMGLPVWTVLMEDYPEVIDLLEREGVDPRDLMPPSALAAGMAAGLVQPEGSEPVESEEEEGEVLVEAMRG